MPTKTEYPTTDQFGDLPKHHRGRMRDAWRRNGINIDNFDEIYLGYLNSTHCQKCNIEYDKRTNRCLDHCHKTGNFRYYLCRSCNSKYYRSTYKNNTTGERNIVPHQVGGIWNYRVSIRHNGKDYVKQFNMAKYSLEDAIAWRDETRTSLGLHI
jgi:hypothetical protein